MKTILINPVLNKELKLRFRSGKTFIGLLFYLLALTLLMVAYMYIETLSQPNGFFKPENSRTLFMFFSFFQLGLILFITPGLTGGVISSERERQTLNMLLTTTQSSTGIIVGKLLSSISYLLLLLIASLPLYSFVFLYGGVSPLQLLYVFLFTVFTMVVIGTFGIMFSTLIRKTIVSMVTTYSTVLFMVGGTAIITVILIQVAMLYSSNGNIVDSPYFYFTAMLNPGVVLVGIFEPDILQQIKEYSGIEFPIWIAHCISYILLTAGALLISISKLRPKMNKSTR